MKPRTLTAPERLEDRYAMDATGLIDIPAVRLIAEHAYLQLHAELGANIWTSWERYGTSGTGGILRSIGTGDGNPGNPDNPSATDALALQFSTPITRPTTVKLWTEGMAPASVYAWVNSAQRRIDAGSDGTIRIDASAQNPINNLSILGNNGGTGRYGIDSFDIAGDPEPDPVKSPDQAPEPAAGSQPDAGTNAPSGDIVLPGELDDLLAEAIALSRNGPEWRTPETGEVVASALRKGLHLNLRAAEAPVVGLRATVAANGAAVTASVYRGTEVLATVAVATDGAFSYAYENGFTDVLFTTANAASVSVTNAHITTDETMQPIAGDAVGIMTSKPYALAAAPVVPIPNDVAYVAGTLKFTTSSSIGTDSRRYFVRDPSLFTLITINASGGSGRITMVGTIKKEGVDYRGREYGSTSGFPEGYARWVADGVVAIAPGAPAPISFIASGPGTFSVTQAQTLEELLPPATMSATTLDTDIMTMNDQFQTAGIFPPLAEVREGSSPTFSRPGDIANLQYHVRNSALAGGQITARSYVSWYSGEPTRGTLQGTFNLSMGGIQTQRVSVNVTAPAKPTDATSDRPIISMVLTLPNGTAVLANAKLGKEPKSHEKRVFTDNGDGTTTMRIESGEYTRREQARIHALTDRALEALLSSNDSRLIAARTALGDDHIVDLIAKNTATALAVGDAVNSEKSADEAVTIADELIGAEIALALDGIGGTENDGAVLWDPNALSKDQNVHAYNISKNDLLTRLSPEEITILKKTALGRFFLGISQRAVEAKSDAEIVQITNNLYDATGISPHKTSIFLRAASEPARRVDMLKQLFAPSVEGQGDALLRTIFQVRTPANDSIFATSISLTESKHVRIRFDFATEDFDFHHGNVYLMSANGQQLSDRPLLRSPFADQFFIDIPMSNIALEVRNIFGVDMLDILDTNFRFKIALWDEANDTNGLHGNNITDALSLPDVVTMNRPGYVQTGDHSTLPDTSQNALRRKKENVVLSILSNPNVFPLRSPAINSGQWYWNIASPYHDGLNQFNAVDLTMAGTTDRGKQVNAPEDGEVVPGGDGTDDWHTVILKHTGTLPTGESFVWFSKYLHMDHVGIHNSDGSITTLVAGMFVPKDAAFGSVGSVGSGIDNDHMHMSVHLDSADGASVDMRRILIDEFHFTVKAEDAGPDGSQMNYYDNTSLLVVWNNEVKAFVTTTQSDGSNPHLILDRSQQDQTANVPAAESNQFWVAFSNIAEERKRIAFRTIPKVQLTDGTIINNYSGWFGLDANGNIIEWKNNEWSSIAII